MKFTMEILKKKSSAMRTCKCFRTYFLEKIFEKKMFEQSKNRSVKKSLSLRKGRRSYQAALIVSISEIIF